MPFQATPNVWVPPPIFATNSAIEPSGLRKATLCRSPALFEPIRTAPGFTNLAGGPRV